MRVRSKSFLLGLSLSIKYHKMSVTPIHKNERSIEIESPNDLIIVRLRNHEIQPIHHNSRDVQNDFGCPLRVLNCPHAKLKRLSMIIHQITQAI